jgi:hypothetical protein
MALIIKTIRSKIGLGKFSSLLLIDHRGKALTPDETLENLEL